MTAPLGFRLAAPAPLAAFDSFDRYITLSMTARNDYRRLMRVEQTACFSRSRLDVRMCSWPKARREGAALLRQVVGDAEGAAAWAGDTNDALVFSLRASACAYAWHHPRFALSDLLDLLYTQLDFLLGYPDCCWGWTGPGVLRELMHTSFYAMISPPTILFVPRSAWPLHQLALLMARHPRLGARSGLRDTDEHILRLALLLAVEPCGPEPRVCLA